MIMERYAPHLRAGDHITLGIEDDPCRTYRSVPKCATIKDVNMESDGTLRFTATDDDGNLVERTNRDVRPDHVWEISPSYLPEFTQRFRATGTDIEVGSSLLPDTTQNETDPVETIGDDDIGQYDPKEDDPKEDEPKEDEPKEDDAKDLLCRIETLERRIDSLLQSNDRHTQESRLDILSQAVQLIAEDLCAVENGYPSTFARNYLDRYAQANAYRSASTILQAHTPPNTPPKR